MNLDQPVLVQYAHYLKQLLRGDLGQSFKFQALVRRIIFERYPATLHLAFRALLVCAAIAIPWERPTVAGTPATAPSEGVLVENDW